MSISFSILSNFSIVNAPNLDGVKIYYISNLSTVKFAGRYKKASDFSEAFNVRPISSFYSFFE